MTQALRPGCSGKVGGEVSAMPEARTARMAASSSGAMGDEDTGMATGCGSAGVVEQAANVIVTTTISTAPRRPVMVATLNYEQPSGPPSNAHEAASGRDLCQATLMSTPWPDYLRSAPAVRLLAPDRAL